MVKARILVVEDEEDIVELVNYNLTKEGYRAEYVTSGEDALRKVKESVYDLIVLDLMLPGVDGLEVCKILKNDSHTTHIPIIMLTAKSEESNAIIDDLLMLSKIEQDEEGKQILLQEGNIKDVLDAAVMGCENAAQEKNVTIEVQCANEILANINKDLLVQAVVNLLDNAIKYSDPGGFVNVRAMQGEHEVVIAIEDSGCGIPAEHLPRIFERFYRVDKARSRKIGGTGLGLAIVKHIANAHRGQATVESTPGEGSTFSIIIPVH